VEWRSEKDVTTSLQGSLITEQDEKRRVESNLSLRRWRGEIKKKWESQQINEEIHRAKRKQQGREGEKEKEEKSKGRL